MWTPCIKDEVERQHPASDQRQVPSGPMTPWSSLLPSALACFKHPPCSSTSRKCPGDRHGAEPYSVTPNEHPDHSVVCQNPGSSALPTPATHAQTGFKDTAPRFDCPATGLTATPCLVPREMAPRLSSVNKQQVYLLRALDLPKAATGPQSAL